MRTALVIIFVFGIIVLIHELGHFTVAKLVGIKIHEFAIGMGPKLLQVKKGETAYSIRAFPLGGYIKMEGEDENSEDLRSFNKKTPLERISVIFAGPFMNFVLSLILFTIIFYSVGSPLTIIKNVTDQSPAQIAGIENNDKIVEINGYETKDWNSVADAIGKSKEESIEISIIRNNEKINKTVIPTKDINTDKIIIGIEPYMKQSLVDSIKNSVNTIYMIISDILSFLKGLITQQSSSGEVMGPVGIISLVSEVSKTGWLDIINLTSVLSINLGLMNLLPIPALDGSRILFLLVELIRGKPVDPEKEGIVHLIGFALLMSFMVFITYKDILKLFS